MGSKRCDQELGSDYLLFHGARLHLQRQSTHAHTSFVAKSKTIDSKCKNHWNCPGIDCMFTSPRSLGKGVILRNSISSLRQDFLGQASGIATVEGKTKQIQIESISLQIPALHAGCATVGHKKGAMRGMVTCSKHKLRLCDVLKTQLLTANQTHSKQKRGLVTCWRQKVRLRIRHVGNETWVGHTLKAKRSIADKTRRKQNVGWSHAQGKKFDCG